MPGVFALGYGTDAGYGYGGSVDEFFFDDDFFSPAFFI